MSMWDQPGTAFTKITGDAANFLNSTFDINSFASDFVDKVKQQVQKVASIDLFRLTSAAARNMRFASGADIVRQLEQLGEFQMAPPVMQPFLVAMPEYRTLYNNNMAAGFENGFAKHDQFRGNAYMHTDANYREATDGMVTEYHPTHLFNWVLPEEREGVLSRINKVDLQICWSRARDLDWEDSDPYSEYNASCY